MIETKNLINRNGNYSLKRRVPRQYQSIESRKVVWISLHTDSLSEAKEKAQDVWANQIAGWEAQLAGRSSDATKHFDAVQKVALAKGIKYLPMPEVARLPSDQLYDRLELIGTRNGNLNSMEAAALLGAVDVPSITVSAALEEYWGLTKDKILRKSKDQIRRWRNPKIKAVRNYIDVVGDKPIAEITREDMLTFRNWWLERIEREGISPHSANKDLIHLGNVLKLVNDMKKLGLGECPVHKLNLSEGIKKLTCPIYLNTHKLDAL